MQRRIAAPLGLRSLTVTAAAVVTALSLAPGDARAATPSRYARYLIERSDIPGIESAPAVLPLTRRTLRLFFGASAARWMVSHGFTAGAADAPEFNEPGVSRPDTGLAQGALAAFRTRAAATGAAARFLAFNRSVSGAPHRPPLRLPGVPSARLVVEYGRVTGGTRAHPAAAAAIWTEGRCMLSVSVGGDTAQARESYTRYAERALRRIERRTHGRCPLGR